MNNKNESNESGVDSDKSYKEKLRKKFAKKFREKKSSISDFSESGFLVSNTGKKEQMVKNMDFLRYEIEVRCFGIQLLIKDLTGPELDQTPYEIKRLIGENMEPVVSLWDKASKRIDTLKKEVSTMSSNNSSVPYSSSQDANNSAGTPSTSGMSGCENPPPPKKPRKTFSVSYSMDLSLSGLSDCVNKINDVSKFIKHSKVEDLDKLEEIAAKIRNMADNLKDTLVEANKL